MITEQDVEDFWNEVKRLQELNESPDPIYEYRLYYDSKGKIVAGYPFITNKPVHEDMPSGAYIVVSKADYENHVGKIVKDGVLQKKRLYLM